MSDVEGRRFSASSESTLRGGGLPITVFQLRHLQEDGPDILFWVGNLNRQTVRAGDRGMSFLARDCDL